MQEAAAEGAIPIDIPGEPFRSSKDTDQVFAALVAAQDEMRGIEKTGRNDHQKYDYAKLEDYVRAARPILAKHGLAITKSVCGFTTLPMKPKADGKVETRVVVRLAIRIVHKSGQWIEGYSMGEGGDYADKATYKAITGARKYGIAAALNLATTDDPEADEEYVKRAMGTVDMADVATIESLKNAFAKVQVTEQMIEGYIGHPVVSMTQSEVEKLRGIFGSINSGKSKVTDYFTEGADGKGKKKAAA
ncbi:MAG: ERF family protein [Bacillota bacterium]